MTPSVAIRGGCALLTALLALGLFRLDSYASPGVGRGWLAPAALLLGLLLGLGAAWLPRRWAAGLRPPAPDAAGACEIPDELRHARIEPVEFGLRALLADVLECLQRESGDVAIRCRADLPDRVVGDPAWIGPLVLWAGRSAARATGGGRVRVSLSGETTAQGLLGLRFEVEGRGGSERAEAVAAEIEAPPVRRLLSLTRAEIEVGRGGAGESSLSLRLPVDLPAAVSV